jgi:uncharacterized protein YjbI with pentapeptide repeats
MMRPKKREHRVLDTAWKGGAMDHESFDRIARLLGSAGSRRTALGAVLGTGLAGAIGGTEAAKKKRRSGKKDRAQVSAQAADCSSPGPSSNNSDCDFAGDDFSGDDLSGSRMVRTNFRRADMILTNLSSSNAKEANFRGANLRGANLSDSILRGADFRGIPDPTNGRETDLTCADLSSSACGGIQFNGLTIFCQTKLCDGTIDNSDCVGTPPVCCGPNGECPPSHACDADRSVCELIVT